MHIYKEILVRIPIDVIVELQKGETINYLRKNTSHMEMFPRCLVQIK